jgi:hypothetical protein
MDRVINFNILANPANWLIVFFVLYLVALIAQVLAEAATNGAPISLPSGL